MVKAIINVFGEEIIDEDEVTKALTTLFHKSEILVKWVDDQELDAIIEEFMNADTMRRDKQGKTSFSAEIAEKAERYWRNTGKKDSAKSIFIKGYTTGFFDAINTKIKTKEEQEGKMKMSKCEHEEEVKRLKGWLEFFRGWVTKYEEELKEIQNKYKNDEDKMEK